MSSCCGDLASLRRAIVEAGQTLYKAGRDLEASESRQREAEDHSYMLSMLLEEEFRGTDHHLDKAEYTTEITSADKLLAAADHQIAVLESQISKSSQTSSDERVRRIVVLTKVACLLDEIRLTAQCAKKQGEGGMGATKESLRAVRELTRERETCIAMWSRQIADLECVVDLKRERACRFRLEAEQRLMELHAAQELEVKECICAMQHERAVLQGELEAIKSTNRSLLEGLKEARSACERSVDEGDGGGCTSALGSCDDRAKRTMLLCRLKASEREQAHLGSLIEELRLQYVTECEEHEEYEQSLRVRLSTQHGECERLERENKHLKALCDSLSASIRSGLILERSS